MTVLASVNPDIRFLVYDKKEAVVAQWNALAELPFYEPQHKEMLHQVLGKNLHFTADAKEAIDQADVIYIAVDTPSIDIPPSTRDMQSGEE